MGLQSRRTPRNGGKPRVSGQRLGPTFWKWAEARDYCEGRNPFEGHRRNLTEGRNKRGYLPWQTKELQALFGPPPKRGDVTEVMLVAMFTGMRLNEIASLTYGQLFEEEGVPVIEVTDAKTVAGERKVPLHPKLSWLMERGKGQPPEARVWPKFAPEGPGKKPGGDAGKEFSRFKRARGFTDRRKVFHSFRKNVVGQLEAARIPQNEVAQLVGHEKQGLTFGTYGDELTMRRQAEIVALIDYPGVPLPEIRTGRSAAAPRG
jgi:integrase